MASEKALKKGDAQPPVSPDKMRIYSMRFCPFAQRTRLVLNHKGFDYDTVNINLREKPEWFADLNPLTRVPVIQYKGDVVFESRVCNQFLDESYPDKGQGRLLSDTPLKRAQDEMLMAFYDSKVIPPFYQLIDPEKAPEAIEPMRLALAKMEKHLGDNKFYGGDKPGFVDFHVYPWLDRLRFIKELSQHEPLTQEATPKLLAWIERMWILPAVQKAATADKNHIGFYKSVVGKATDYDVGLPA